MVAGLDQFRKHFSGHENHYALIGGAACTLIFADAGLQFRATKDIDMVLCVEVVDRAFGGVLKEFLDAGGYQARERNTGRREFFRFHQPTDRTYPFMLELFTRDASASLALDGVDIAPVQVDDNIISLSAILLNDDYYRALISQRRIVEGIHVLDERLLIPFKARAFLDLSRQRREGNAHVKKNDIRKHRNDVFRLLQLLPAGTRVEISDPILQDIKAYIDVVRSTEDFDPRAFQVGIEKTEGLELLARIYGITS